MSEQKPRTSQDCLNDYNNFAFKAGNLQYQIVQHEKDLKRTNESMASVTLEYTKLKNQEDEAKKVEAEKSKVELPPSGLSAVEGGKSE